MVHLIWMHLLLMEPYGFIDAKDIGYVKTVKAIEKELSHEGLLFDIKMLMILVLQAHHLFNTFWFINSLYKIGEKEKSKLLFDQLLS